MRNNSRILGLIASGTAAVCTVLFGIFVISGNKTIYFLTLMPVSMGVIAAIYSMKDFVVPGKKVFADCAAAFGIMYSVLVNMVYFTQMISGVRLGTLSADVLNIVSDKPGTVFFYVDMFGYCMLCLATLFIALAASRKDTFLRIFSFIHSVLFIPTFSLPFLPVNFGTETQKGMSAGDFVLLAWCVLFLPVCVFLAKFFWEQKTEPTGGNR